MKEEYKVKYFKTEQSLLFYEFLYPSKETLPHLIICLWARYQQPR